MLARVSRGLKDVPALRNEFTWPKGASGSMKPDAKFALGFCGCFGIEFEIDEWD